MTDEYIPHAGHRETRGWQGIRSRHFPQDYSVLVNCAASRTSIESPESAHPQQWVLQNQAFRRFPR